MTGEENRQRVRAELDRAERAIAAERFWARRQTRDEPETTGGGR